MKKNKTAILVKIYSRKRLRIVSVYTSYKKHQWNDSTVNLFEYTLRSNKQNNSESQDVLNSTAAIINTHLKHY